MLELNLNNKEDIYFFGSMEQKVHFEVDEQIASKRVPGEVPNNLHEYLQMVKVEREQYPEVMTVSVDIPKKKEIGKEKNRYVPSSEDRKYMLHVFFESRNTITLCLNSKNHCLKDKDCLPSMDDMLGWCAFCLGAKSMFRVKKFVTNQHEIQTGEFSFNPDGYEPLDRFIFSLKPDDIVTLLSYCDIWVQYLHLSSRLSKWIYSLLLVVKRPLTDDANNVLSFLAGSCINIIEKLENEEDLLSLYVIVCAVKSYFECKPKIKKSAKKLEASGTN